MFSEEKLLHTIAHLMKKKFFRVFDAYLLTLTADILKVLYMWNLSRNNITSGVSNIFKELKVENPI